MYSYTIFLNGVGRVDRLFVDNRWKTRNFFLTEPNDFSAVALCISFWVYFYIRIRIVKIGGREPENSRSRAAAKECEVKNEQFRNNARVCAQTFSVRK